MDNKTVIGIVSATVLEPSDENTFCFFITKCENDDSTVLGRDDIIKVERTLPGANSGFIYASVVSVQHFSDAPEHVANFISYNFGHVQDNSLQLPRIGYCLVSAKVVYNENDVYYPVKTGDRVYLCDDEKEVMKVLYLNYEEEEKKYFAIAIHDMYKGNKPNELKIPVLLHSDYLSGPKNAHLNISGISGGAAKTTKALSISKCLFDKYPDETTVILFNTKDKDLMTINKPDINNKAENDELEIRNLKFQGRSSWYDKVHFIYPAGMGESEKNRIPFYASIKKIQETENLDMLVANDPDDSGTMYSCSKYMENDNNDSWAGFLKAIPINKTEDKEQGEIKVESWRKYKRLVNKIIPSSNSLGIFSDRVPEGGDDLISLINKHINDGLGILVIDIAGLDMLQQAFVFGCAIRTIETTFKEKRRTDRAKKLVVFVDELNKYASAGTPVSSPILESLINIAETGRSSGICLMTAEQSLSVIHPRIKNNIATQVIGRTASLELSTSDFSSISPSAKNRVSFFRHEEALVASPTVNAGYLHAKFPNKFFLESE